MVRKLVNLKVTATLYKCISLLSLFSVRIGCWSAFSANIYLVLVWFISMGNV